MRREFILQRTDGAFLDVPETAWYEVGRYLRFDRAWAAWQRLSRRAHQGTGWAFNTRLLDSRTEQEVETYQVWDFQYRQIGDIPKSHISAEFEVGGGSGNRAVTVLSN